MLSTFLSTEQIHEGIQGKLRPIEDVRVREFVQTHRVVELLVEFIFPFLDTTNPDIFALVPKFHGSTTATKLFLFDHLSQVMLEQGGPNRQYAYMDFLLNALSDLSLLFFNWVFQKKNEFLLSTEGDADFIEYETGEMLEEGKSEEEIMAFWTEEMTNSFKDQHDGAEPTFVQLAVNRYAAVGVGKYYVDRLNNVGF